MRKTTPDIERILGNLDRSGDCWTWKLYIQASGYAKTSVGSAPAGTKRDTQVHRFVYEALVGPIPEGLVLDHLCRNRACSNPEHLEAVTNGENIRRGVFRTRTHCPHGHSYADHAYHRKNRRGPECRVCIQANNQRQYQRRRAANVQLQARR